MGILELLPFFHQIFKTIFRSLNVYEIEVILPSPLTEDFFEESWLVHSITGHNFETRHPSEDSDQVWFPLV
jgi:hypothetical protein